MCYFCTWSLSSLHKFSFQKQRENKCTEFLREGSFLNTACCTDSGFYVYLWGWGWGTLTRVHSGLKHQKWNVSHCFQPAPWTSAGWLLSVPVKRSCVWEWKPWYWLAGEWRERQKSWLGILPLDLRCCVAVCFLRFLEACLLIAAF